jgi:hypothetical protein
MYLIMRNTAAVTGGKVITVRSPSQVVNPLVAYGSMEERER